MMTIMHSVEAITRDPGSLSGRTALVTGASRGIGAATARRLGASGARLILTARGPAVVELAEELERAGVPASAILADLSDRGSLERLMEQVARRTETLDIVVNNAGMLPVAKRADRVTWDAWDTTLALNLSAPWYIACRAREMMASGGVVVNVASTASYYPSPGLAAYNVSKSALVMLTRSLALDWSREGIRVVGVAPGKVDTELVAPVVEWATARDRRLNPLNRIGHSAEVAELIAYLVSEAASYMTGVTVPIDGGELLDPAG
jgi:NAD(P)-dependent dehydrogenase (short-subunit alcohol dehydrogenase family)